MGCGSTEGGNSGDGRVLVALSTDAFGRLRVSNPQALFDSKQIADNQPLFWDDAETSGGGTSSTYNANQASTTIAVGNLTAGVRVRQTKRWFNYQPGKSQLIFMTFVLGTGAAGITKRVGQFETSNGLYLEQLGTTLSFVRRTGVSGAPVNNVVNQAAWNLDTLNGSGASGGNPSGITLNPANAQILIIDYEWLGVGSVRMGFVIGGQIIYCHQFNNANVLTTVYMGSPNLPLRYEIANDGTGPAASLVYICAQVSSEGGQSRTGIDFSVSRGATALTTLNNANLYPLCAIRLRAGYLFATVVPRDVSVMVTSTASYRWALLLNPTVAGTAFSFTTVPNSAVEADVARTNATTVTGGLQIATGYGQAQLTGDSRFDLGSDIALGSTIAGVSDVLVLAAQRVVGTTEAFYGAIAWHEEQ